MKFPSKILAAAVAAVALTSNAHAALSTPSSGNGDLLLYVWDTNPSAAVPNQSYTLDTGLSLSSLLALTSGTSFDVGGSTNFKNLFASADITGGFVDWTVIAGNDKTANAIAVTGGTGTPAWQPGQTYVGTVDGFSDNAATFLNPIAGSSTEYQTSAAVSGNGNLLGFNLIGNTTTSNSAIALTGSGSTLSLYESVSVPNGGTPRKPTLNPATVTPLGITATLLANGELDLAVPSAVPLPAAAWLLGSGVLGLLGVGRRRRAA